MIRLAAGCCGLFLISLPAAQAVSATVPDPPSCLSINGQAPAANCSGSSQTLLAYLQSLKGSKILSGQTGDPYSGSPFDVFSGSAPNWYIGGTNGNVQAAIFNNFVQGPDNGGSPTMQNLQGSNSFVNSSNAWIAAGGILYVTTEVVNPANPNAGSNSSGGGSGAGSPCSSSSTGWLYNSDCAWAGSYSDGNFANVSQIGPFTYSVSGTQYNTINPNNPWPAVITPGTAVYNAWQANIDQLSALLAQINGPFLFAPYGEVSWQYGTNDWFDQPTTTSSIPGSNTPSMAAAANYVALWKQTYNRMMVSGPYAAQLKNKILWVFDLGGGDGGDITNTLNGFYPGSAYVDVIGIDDDSAMTNSINSNLSSLQQTFAGIAANSGTNTKPVFFASTWATGTGNMNTDVCAPILANFFPASGVYVFGYVEWAQTSLNNNSGAQACTQAPFTGMSSVPHSFSNNK